MTISGPRALLRPEPCRHFVLKRARDGGVPGATLRGPGATAPLRAFATRPPRGITKSGARGRCRCQGTGRGAVDPAKSRTHSRVASCAVDHGGPYRAIAANARRQKPQRVSSRPFAGLLLPCQSLLTLMLVSPTQKFLEQRCLVGRRLHGG